MKGALYQNERGHARKSAAGVVPTVAFAGSARVPPPSFSSGHQGHIYRALARRFILTRVVIEEDGWPQRLSDFPEGGEFDAILWRVRSQELIHRPPFDWEGYPGPRIMLDHDTCRSYMQIAPGSDTLGMWPPMIHRQGFDLVLVSGKRVCELLRADGVPAVWMPKAYAADWLFDTGTDRGGIGYYGTPYPACGRCWITSTGPRSRIPVSVPRNELNDQLNRYLGVVICNMGVPLEGGAKSTGTSPKGRTDSHSHRKPCSKTSKSPPPEPPPSAIPPPS